MTPSLYAVNSPSIFWKLLSEPAPDPMQWDTAVTTAARIVLPCFSNTCSNYDFLLDQILGEGQFGPNHWQLSPAKHLYYNLKPFLPRWLTRLLRRAYKQPVIKNYPICWPIEERYAQFQWETIKQLLFLMNKTSFPFIHFWPEGQDYALVLTHDVETAEGQAYVHTVVDLEESQNLRSSFNFVPEKYALDYELMQNLRERGFEVAVHGLKHDGKLFNSPEEFTRRARRINRYLKDWQAVGFRSPLTLRQPEWMQILDIEYDLSFFDTDPYEPMPGGTMSLWPYMIGRFVELPYTLIQDYPLTRVFQETTPNLWLQKVAFLRRYHGMALVNTHPDYLRHTVTWRVYEEFLRDVKAHGRYWNALPRDVARWWRARCKASAAENLPGAEVRNIRMINGQLTIS